MKRQQTIKFLTALTLAGGFSFSATHPAVAVQFAVTTCTLAAPTPCVGGTNTSTGPGIQGISNLGFGNVGQTKFNSTSSSNGKSGILGQDLSTSGTNDEGVRGTSVRGIGVHGMSSSRSGVRGDATSAQGVFGSSSSNAGAQGVSVSGNGVVGQSTSTSFSGHGGVFSAAGGGDGVVATAAHSGFGGSFTSTNGIGVVAQSNGTGSLGIFATGNTGIEANDRVGSTADVIFSNGHGANLFRANNSHGIDVMTLFDNGTLVLSNQATVGGSSSLLGVFGHSTNIGLEGGLTGTLTGFKAGVQGDNTSDASTIAVRANGFGGRLFVGNNSGGTDVFSVDNNGNLFVQGNVSAHSYSTHAAPTTIQRTRTGGEVTTFANQGAAPTIEDFGEARLSGGSAYVPLKSSFGLAIDRNQPYLVFITPQGPVRGTVYVMQKDARGFTVRETGGTSNVAFDYRILAKPYVTQTGTPAGLQTNVSKKLPVVPAIRKTTKTTPVLKPMR